VRYILEGSLQRDNENVRINTQLIDAETGRHLWAENYDRKFDDIFSVQDEICKSIMVALQVKLTMGDQARMGADTGNIKAYEKYLKAREYYLRRTWEETLVARQLFQEAISLWKETLERNPDFIFAYMGLTMAYWFTGSQDQARQTAQQVLRVNPKFSVDYWEKRSTLKDKALREQLFDAWRMAGLK